MAYLKPKQLIIKDCARRFVLKLYRHEALDGLFATAELLVDGGRPPSWISKICSFLSRDLCRHAVLLPGAKFSWNRTIGWWVKGQKSDFRDGGRRHLEFKFLVTRLSSCSISAVVCQISSKSDDFSLLRYGDLTIFKMAAVRHLGFVMTSQDCIAGHIFVVQILSWNFLSIGVVVSEIIAIS